MLYAIDKEGQKIRPIAAGQPATDPFTGGLVHGIIDKVNYWQLRDRKYDPWALPSTSSWSLNWKLAFAKEMVEIVIEKGSKRHIADVQTDKKIVFKFQPRMLTEEQLTEREKFFETMVWIFDARQWQFNLNFEVSHFLSVNRKFRKLPDPPSTYQWVGFHSKYPKHAFATCLMPIFLDFGDDNIYWLNWQRNSSIGAEFIANGGVMKAYNKADFIEKYTKL